MCPRVTSFYGRVVVTLMPKPQFPHIGTFTIMILVLPTSKILLDNHISKRPHKHMLLKYFLKMKLEKYSRNVSSNLLGDLRQAIGLLA
jgi:hypothetical protein